MKSSTANYLRFLQFFTIATISILPFFPVQIDTRIIYVIGLFALFLLPRFVKSLKEDIANKNTITIFYILFLVVSIISTIFSIDQKRSVAQCIVFASSFIVFTSIRSIFPTQRSKELLVTCYLLLVTFLSLISLYNTLSGHYVNWDGEGVSFLWIYYGHNHLSALLLFAIPIVYYLLKKHWKIKPLNILLLVTCYLLLITLFFTFSISSILSLITSFLITLFLFRPAGIKRLVLTGITTLTVLAVLFLGVLYFGQALKENVKYQKNTISSVKTRISYLQDSAENAVAKPLTGSGLDTFRIVSSKSRRPGIKTYYTHNFFFQMLSDSGIFGFLASIGLVISLLWQVRRKLNAKIGVEPLVWALWCGIFASTLNTFVDFDWQLPYVFLLFWTIAGIAIN